MSMVPQRLFICSQTCLDRLYVCRRRAFGTLDDIEADALAFGQRLETARLDGAVMHENIPAFILFDESKALLLIEPLHFTFWHRLHPPFFNFPKSDFSHAGKKKQPKLKKAWQAPSTLQNVLIQTYVDGSLFPRPVKVKDLFGQPRTR